MKKIFFLIVFSGTIFCYSEDYKGWEKSWAGVFLTGEEVKEFKKLKTERERELFISNFWKRRDPTPKTEENEFRERCEVLANYADKEFSIKGKMGSETDRGMILLLLGHPSYIKRQELSFFKEKEGEFIVDSFDYEIEKVAHSLEGAPMEYENSVIEVWIYKREVLPFEIPSSNLIIFFIKEKGEKDFHLFSKTKNLKEILEKARRQYIFDMQ